MKFIIHQFVIYFSMFFFSLYFVSSCAVAQEKFVEVAVGVATKGKDKLMIETFECNGPGVSTTNHREIVEIVRNDLSFYQHVFEVFNKSRLEKEVSAFLQ